MTAMMMTMTIESKITKQAQLFLLALLLLLLTSVVLHPSGLAYSISGADAGAGEGSTVGATTGVTVALASFWLLVVAYCCSIIFY